MNNVQTDVAEEELSTPGCQVTTRNNTLVILVATVAAVAGVLSGFGTAVISGAILYIQNEFALSAWANGAVVSSVLVGALVGSAFSGRTADYFGRRVLLIITALIFLVGTLGSAFAFSVTMLIVSRVVVGVAIGIASFTAPLYISEIAPANLRGALVSLNQLAMAVGIVLSYSTDTYFAEQGGDWRWMFAMGVIPALVLLVGMFFLPRSPRWLVLRHRTGEARATLAKIRRSAEVAGELKEIESSIHQRTSWRLLFQKWLRPALIIGLGLAFFQQCTGINTIIYYAPTVFEMAGFHSASVAILATLGVGIVNVLLTIAALPLIDSWGRRPLLILGLSGMAIGLMGLSVLFHSGADSEHMKWIAMGSIMLYIASFAISLGPIMWLMFAEVYPLQVRALGSSMAASASWGFNAIIAYTFLHLIQSVGASGTFLFYAFMCGFALLFVFFLIPETKGVPLEQIESNLRAGVKSRFLGRPGA